MYRILALIGVSFFLLIACTDSVQSEDSKQGVTEKEYRPVLTGASRLIDEFLPLLKGKNIGLVANPTARVHNSHLLDTLLYHQVNIKALFAPEHGFRGNLPAGEEVKDGYDVETGLPVFSLYGRSRKPTPEMLQGLDILIFDMQDVGVRFYTYISTLGLVLEAASENDVEVWVLDRPNPLGGEYVSGFLLEEEFKSFVGMFPIPVAHGLTLGEIAQMIVKEAWMNFPQTPKLRILKMEHWERSMVWPDTRLEWRAPSPNLPHFSNALVYPGTCFIEGTTMSEGRGTSDPFMIVGNPDLAIPDSVLTDLMRRYPVLLERIVFTPVSIPGVATSPKHENVQVNGLKITPQTLNPSELKPVEFGLELTREMLRFSASARTNRFMYNLAGSRRIDDFLNSDKHPVYFWQQDVERFRELREAYLLY